MPACVVPVELAQTVCDVVFQHRMFVDLRVVEGVLKMRVRPDGRTALAHETHVPFPLELAQVVVLHLARKKVAEILDAYLHVSDVVMLQYKPVLLSTFPHLNGLLPANQLFEITKLDIMWTVRGNGPAENNIKNWTNVRKLAQSIEPVGILLPMSRVDSLPRTSSVSIMQP